MELQRQRLTGGVSVGTQHWEGGLGVVYDGTLLGATGYLQYLLTVLTARLQVDLLSNQEWLPQFTMGIPITANNLQLEPHLLWSLGANSHNPKLGLRIQYRF